MTSWTNLDSAARGFKICLCLFLFCASLRGIDRDRRLDELYHTRWTLKDGAPSQIFAMAQTADGYLWLGTTTGLVRFDGIHFEAFEQAFRQGLPSRNVSSLLAVPDGGLWIGFASGQASLLKNGRVTSYGAKDGLPASTVRSLVRDRRDRIWAASLTGLSLFDGSRWKGIGTDWNFSGGATAALVDRAGTVWIGTQDRVLFLPEGTNRFQVAAQNVEYVTSLAQAPSGVVWMAQISGVICPVQLPVTRQGYLKFNATALKILFDDQGSLWAATLGTGIRRIAYPDRLGGQKLTGLNPLTELSGRADGLTSNYIETVLQDGEGDMWVGTSTGLDRFRQSPVSAVDYPSTEYVSLAPADRGTVWVAPAGRPMLLVRDRRLSNHLPAEFAPLRGQAFTTIHRGSDAALWMATDRGLLRMFDGRLTKFEYPHGSKIDPDGKGSAMTMTDGRAGAIWVSVLGDQVYKFAGGAWNSLEALGGPKGFALSAFTGADGRVWLGMLDQSVVCIDGGKVRVFSAREGVQVGKVRSIHVYGSNAWIGGDTGVARYDGTGFRPLVPAGGKVFRDVFGVLETDEGLWLSENSGIIFVPHSEILLLEKDSMHRVNFRGFGFLHGLDAPLQRSTVNPALVQSTDGLLWFAAAQGLAFVNPRRVQPNAVPPPVSITSLVADTKTYVPAPGMTLPDRVKNLEIDYVGISLAMPEQVRYRYKLEGYDADWQEPGLRRQAFYTNPGPGSYTFRVMAENSDGVWNEAGAVLGFSIAFAFYETLWFRTLCAFAAAGIACLLYLLRLRLVTAQLQARLGERLQERERIARELHDTLLQSFQGLMLRLQVVDDLLLPGTAKAHLEQSLVRADQAIAEGRSAVHNLRSTTGGDLAEALRTVAGELAGDNPPPFHLIVEGGSRDLDPILRDEVYRIACEGIRNAFHHARAKQIEVEIAYEERCFRLRIRDDGGGIPPGILQGGRSGHYGLSGMRERAQQIAAKLDIWSRAGGGTEIDLSIPGSIAYGRPARGARWRLFRKNVG